MLLLLILLIVQVLQPLTYHYVRFGHLSRSLAATSEISVDYFSYRYLDVSVPYVRSCMAALLTIRFLTFLLRGLPHSETPRSKDTYLLSEVIVD